MTLPDYTPADGVPPLYPASEVLNDPPLLHKHPFLGLDHLP